MAELLDYTRAALGIWLGAIAGIHEGGASALRIGLGVVAFLLMVSAIAGRRAGSLATARFLRWLGLAVGVALLTMSIAWFPHLVAWTLVNALLVAFLACVASIAALRIGGAARRFSLVATDGTVLMEVTGLEMRGTELAVRGKMMGTMPAVALLRPSELRNALNCLTPAVLLRMPVMLVRALVTTATAPRSATGYPPAPRRGQTN